MAYLAPPTVDPCDYTDYVVDSGPIVDLWPGVYCGKLEVNSGGEAFLNPGVYIMDDALFKARLKQSKTKNKS